MLMACMVLDINSYMAVWSFSHWTRKAINAPVPWTSSFSNMFTTSCERREPLFPKAAIILVACSASASAVVAMPNVVMMDFFVIFFPFRTCKASISRSPGRQSKVYTPEPVKRSHNEPARNLPQRPRISLALGSSASGDG